MNEEQKSEVFNKLDLLPSERNEIINASDPHATIIYLTYKKKANCLSEKNDRITQGLRF